MTTPFMDISVIISTRNRAHRLQLTLEHFEGLDCESISWELLVVDNGSVDATPEVLSVAKSELPLISLHESIPGKNRALNRAISVARGKLLVFTDDDIIANTDWLQNYLAGAERWPSDNIFGGRIDPLMPSHTPPWIASPKFEYAGIAFGRYDPSPTEGPVEIPPYGANLAIRANFFHGMRFNEQIGPKGKNYAMGSETELLMRIHKEGHRFIYLPSARVRHVVDSHQICLHWLLGRARLAGRGMVRRSEPWKGPWLFGVPRHLWRQVAASFLRYTLARFRGDTARFEAGRQFYSVVGMIEENRKMRREIQDARNDELGTFASDSMN